MNCIFLDIDGVLNSDQDATATKYKMRVDGDGYLGIYKPRLRKLKQIVDATGAIIVLTSSWKDSYVEYLDQYKRGVPSKKRNHEGRYLRNKFREVNLEIYDTTLKYEFSEKYRGHGIKVYLKDHPEITNWIVIDDAIFNDYDKDIRERLIFTDYTEGLNDINVIDAIEKLKTK